MELPPFEIETGGEKRELVSMSEINVTRDLFSIEFDFYAT